MKTLLEYLLLEAEQKNAPEDFTRVSLSGGLSKEAQELLGYSSYKKARKANAQKSEKVKAGLEFKGNADISDPIKFVKSFFESDSKLTTYITYADDSKLPRWVRKNGGNSEERAFLQMKSTEQDGSWKDVGGKGKIKSSIRVIRFWIESTMTAYTGKVKDIGFAYDEASNLFCVYKKK